VEKVSPKCGLPLLFSKKLSKVNNHPMDENSPNLVALEVTWTLFSARSFFQGFYTYFEIELEIY
jgi:hypothetical protein